MALWALQDSAAVGQLEANTFSQKWTSSLMNREGKKGKLRIAGISDHVFVKQH